MRKQSSGGLKKKASMVQGEYDPVQEEMKIKADK